MHRRRLLRAGTVALPLALAGCSEDDGADGDTGRSDDPDEIDVEALDATDADVDDPQTALTVEYDFRTQVIVQPDEGKELGSAGRSVNLVFQFRVTNDGGQPVRVRPSMFQAAHANDDQVFARNNLDDPDQFPDRELASGATANGWVVFTIPGSVARALMVVRQGQLSVPATVTFERTDLEFTVEDGETGTTPPNEMTAAVAGPE